jgi:uncharacterized NAD(P)/FAD-binding protein YdhS
LKPENKGALHIAIIGGGFCGVMTAIHLMHGHEYPLHIHIINKGYPFAKGVAYSPHTSCLLLNVPDNRMSAFADKPDDYVNWLEKNYPVNYTHEDELTSGFSTREQYGQYLTHLWHKAVNQKDCNTFITTYDDYAYDMVEDSSRFYIYLKQHPVLTVDFVVLATGNVQPRMPSGIPLSFANSKYYFGNPWKNECIENLDPTKDILIIGNGLTMADTVLGLAVHGFTKNIYTVSPHGYSLNPWNDTKPDYTGVDIKEILKGKIALSSLVQNLNRHRKIAQYQQQSMYHAIDAIRPYAQKIWQSINREEKQQFLKYLRHLWGSIRHRVPAKMHGFIEGMYAQKRVFTYKGNVAALSEKDGVVNVTLNCDGVLKHVQVQRIINCTGPEGNLKLSANELLKNLEKRGIIYPDELNMGVNANPENGSVIAHDGHYKNNLFVIGSNLKGILWESTAVPELRVQAQKLAGHLIENINSTVNAVVKQC